MVWVRLDDHFDQHPKFAAAGPLGIALWVAGLAYCNRMLTDGVIPWAVAHRLLSWEYLGAPEAQGRRLYRIGVSCGMHGEDATSALVVELLVQAGLWEVVEGGYRVHDYGDYQPSKEAVEAERKGNAERKRQQRTKGAATADHDQQSGKFSRPAGVTPGQAPESQQESGRESGDGRTRSHPLPVPGPGPGETLAASLLAPGRVPRAGAREEPSLKHLSDEVRDAVLARLAQSPLIRHAAQ